jgi:hypothetical protein
VALVFLAILPGRAAAAGAASDAATTIADRLNVRSRPGFAGEVMAQLPRGQTVSVLGEVTLPKPADGEPQHWLKIGLPSATPVWVATEYVDADSKTVSADMLNVRAGPSGDHGVVGRVKRGTLLKPLGKIRDGWLEIEAPVGAWGFVPRDLIRRSAAVPATTTPPAPSPAATSTPMPATVPATAPVSAPPTDSKPTAPSATDVLAAQATPVTALDAAPAAAPVVPETAPVTSAPSPEAPGAAPAGTETGEAKSAEAAWREQFGERAPATGAPAPVPGESGATVAPAEAAKEAEAAEAGKTQAALTGLPMSVRAAAGESEARWVRREGLVVRPVNFAAPTFHALRARDGGRTVNFLFSTRSEPIPWSEYRGRVVIITGREYLDERSYWRGVPLLDVETIEAVR